MEQARCWMWTKRKHSLSSHLQLSNRSSYDDSWEEQAFAEDAAGPLGGCIWPPRSYSCSFCRREFRSAQALGGHMNVHRRDRARLKQSPPLAHTELLHQHHEHQSNSNLFQTTYSPLGFQYPPHQIGALVYSPNPNSDSAIIASPASPSKPSITPTNQPNCDEKKLFLSSTEKDKKVSPRPSPSSRPNSSVTHKYYNIADPTNEREKNSIILESGCRSKADYLKKDLSVNLNFVVQRSCPTISDGDDNNEEAIGCKRRRTTVSSLPFFVKSDSADRHEIGPCSMEELDLELRLGQRPKVK